MVYSKAAKLKAKRGRPPIPPTEKREPNGRRSRRGESANKERDAMHTAVTTRMRQFAVSEENAKEPKLGHVLGRYRLKGDISEAQYEAGLRYGEDVARYYGLKGLSFPSARAQNLFAVRGSSGEEESASRADGAQKAQQTVKELTRILLDAHQNPNVARVIAAAVYRVCVEDGDMRHMTVEHLRLGLRALAKHYGI